MEWAAAISRDQCGPVSSGVQMMAGAAEHLGPRVRKDLARGVRSGTISVGNIKPRQN
ncbi:hypothetical protein N184_15700 [Sinorhizobium sp. GL28]|nr:hypothetical protein N184_15700 [Sinorhizobium sp. GL28]